MIAARCLLLLASFLTVSAVLAQTNDDVAAAVKIEANVIPYRAQGLFHRVFELFFPPTGYSVVISISFDEQSAAFAGLMYECKFFHGDKDGLTMSTSVRRSEFKLAAEGKLVAMHTSGPLPGVATDAKCRIMDVLK